MELNAGVYPLTCADRAGVRIELPGPACAVQSPNASGRTPDALRQSCLRSARRASRPTPAERARRCTSVWISYDNASTGLHDCASDHFDDMRDDGISEGSSSVH